MKPASPKAPFHIDKAVERLRTAVAPFAKAAMFELFEEGYTTAFEQLVACIISIRTRDEVMLPVARSLFKVARTPAEMSKLTPEQIDRMISRSTFHEGKAKQIRDIAQLLVDEHEGVLPCDRDVMLSLRGVGPKCANLVLGIACDQKQIGVDIHVHRVTNRWGYISAPTPEKSMVALEKVLPEKYWVEINKLLVPFGKHICTGTLPKCSSCPLLDMCLQVGVVEHR